jgi:hypothetical protein
MDAIAFHFPAHSRVGEPMLAFHPERATDRHPHPLVGLRTFGPYSRSLLNGVMDPIRVAAIVPAGEMRVVEGLVGECASSLRAAERRAYLPDFPSFERLFGVRLVLAAPAARVELSGQLDTEIANAAVPHAVLAENIARALARLATVRHEFEVAMIYLPDRWKACFEGLDGDDFDLHAFIKATAAPQGVPTQILNESRVLRYRCRCSVAWRLGIALYAKAGGTPWRLGDIEPDTAFVGLSYAMRRSPEGGPRFVTCCSQVFDADGVGLEFLVYGTADFHVEGDNPFLSRGEMHRVMARSLDLYQRRRAGRRPRRVVVHKTTEFKPEEIDGAFDAFKASESVELIQVQQESGWRGVQIERAASGAQKAGAPSNYPVLRGSYVPIGDRDVLLWTQGDAPDAVDGKHFYKEGKGIPEPLLLRRFAGHGGWEDVCRHVLSLTKMNWNSDSLYGRMPVSVVYAQKLARVVQRMEHLAATPYPSRMFM